MVKRETLIAIVIGVTIFITDLTFGWLTFLTSPFPVIFTIALVIGIIVGKVGDAVKVTFLTWLIGIALACLLGPIIFADLWSDEVYLPFLPLIVMLWSTRGMFLGWEFQGTWVEAMAVAAGMLVAWLVLTPMLYLFSFLVAAIGGWIGRRVHQHFRFRQVETTQAPIETPGIQ